MTATVRYPANEILPYGWHMLTKGDHPTIWLDAFDESIRIDLMGGYSIPDRFASPECVQIKRGGLKGLIPPWKHIDQKGATEDGVTNIDSLYDPAEVQIDVVCRGRDGRHTQQVYRHLIGAIDAKQQNRLNFLTLDEGHWWGSVRWFQGAPPNPVMGAQTRRQEAALRLRVDDSFWRTYDDTDSFRFIYDSMVDEFTTDYSASQNLGPNWPQYYTGAGGGYCSTVVSTGFDIDQAIWYESGTIDREVVNGPYKDFDTDTDNQVIEMVLGTMPEITFVGGAHNHLWGRMGRNPDGTWNGNGIRAAVGVVGIVPWVELSRFNNFTQTVMLSHPLGFIPPLWGEKYSLICGTENDPRLFKILRNGVPVLQHKETGTGSLIGSAYRGVGFGMHAGQGVFSQAAPAWVRKISAGDNAAVTQSGFLRRLNIGDQPMYDDYFFFGPGTVRIYDGPETTDFVEFGPLLANQAAMLRTDPRDRNVYDLAAIPAQPSLQERQIFDAALNGLLSFLSLSNANPLLQVIQSIFGIFGAGPAPVPPQGNMYSLLKGRFSDRSAIPPKSPGRPAQPYFVKCEIVGGNVDSKLISSGTPLRRYPL